MKQVYICEVIDRAAFSEVVAACAFAKHSDAEKWGSDTAERYNVKEKEGNPDLPVDYAFHVTPIEYVD